MRVTVEGPALYREETCNQGCGELCRVLGAEGVCLLGLKCPCVTISSD